MGKLSSLLSNAARFAVFGFVTLACIAQPALAADLPLTSESKLAGIGFDDKPLLLPVQHNFQMAMTTAGAELGRRCGKMEAYGWRLTQSEQPRVDQIFNSTVDRLRGRGYVVEMQNPASISRDITMFTADHANKHLLSMWSAGEIGLVMVLCETSAPPGGARAVKPAASSVQTFSSDLEAELDAPRSNPVKASYANFTPTGTWVGSYMCGQGYTGGTLTIGSMRGNNFDGTFHFYPTAKNPSVLEGSYTVYGQYDRETQRILINPGKWQHRPPNYYNTIIVGGFDPMTQTLSAYFQGINGCTSFEAHRTGKIDKQAAPHRKTAKKKKTKKTANITAPATAPKTAATPTLSMPVTPPPAVPATPAATSGMAPLAVPSVAPPVPPLPDAAPPAPAPTPMP